MNTKRLVSHAAVAIVLSLAAGVTSEISASEYTAPNGLASGGDETFEFGGSCAALAYLSAEQLQTYIRSGFRDDFHSFCFPEEPSECSDYTDLLKGLGRLSAGEDGYHCNLQLPSSR